MKTVAKLCKQLWDDVLIWGSFVLFLVVDIGVVVLVCKSIGVW